MRMTRRKQLRGLFNQTPERLPLAESRLSLINDYNILRPTEQVGKEHSHTNRTHSSHRLWV